MNVSVLACTYGDRSWATRAEEALRSVDEPDVTAYGFHMDKGTLAEVRNHAAKTATTEWLCFLDADDRLAPGYLHAMAGAVLEPTWLSLLVPSVQYVRDGIEGVAEIPAWDRNLIDINCAVIGTLISRNLFLRLGGFREFPSLEDWDLWLRAIKLGARMHPVPSAIYQVAVGDGRNSDQSPYAQIRAEHGPDFDWANVDAYKMKPWQT